MSITAQLNVIDSRRTTAGSLPASSRPAPEAAARHLTAAQKKAVEFAQRQVIFARRAQQERALQHARLLKLQKHEDEDFEATLSVASSSRKNTHEQEGATISFRRTLGQVLRMLRQKDHKTLREVSEKAGVSLGYLSEVERGQKEASSELLGSISNALGMRLSQTLRLVADEIEKKEDQAERSEQPQQMATAA